MSPPRLEQRVEGDTSFERLYRLHRGDVYGAVLRDVRDPTEAEDVTQIAFLNAFRAMRKGERPDKPRAWLVTIARNVVRRRYRELMRRPQEVGFDPEIAAALMEVDGPTADEITSAIRRLPPNQRRVILLREIQGRAYAEIAEEMGLSLAAVETLIFRARRSLSEELEHAERVPITQRRRRGLFFLPLPGFGKLSLGLSLGRSGMAALVGSAAIVTVPLTGGADPIRAQGGERGASAAEAAGPGVSPIASASVGTADSQPGAGRADQGRSAKERDGKEQGGKEQEGSASATEGLAGVSALDVSSLPDAESAPAGQLPVQPPSLPVDPPQLPVDPPPLPVDPPKAPVEPPPPPVDLPDVPDLPPVPDLPDPPAAPPVDLPPLP